MQIARAGISNVFTASFDVPAPSFVAMSVYDTSGVSPVLAQAAAAMTLVTAVDSFIGKFTPVVGKSYLIAKAVYTDGTFTALDNSFVVAVETIYAEASIDPGSLVGVVEC